MVLSIPGRGVSVYLYRVLWANTNATQTRCRKELMMSRTAGGLARISVVVRWIVIPELFYSRRRLWILVGKLVRLLIGSRLNHSVLCSCIL